MRRGAAYAAEFVVVFLGVSLSFLAANVREERSERASERAYLTSFLQCSIMVANTSEYESPKANGGLNRIRDSDFRQRLTENYEMYPDIRAWHRADCTRMEEILEYVAEEPRVETGDAGWKVEVVGSPERVTGDRRFQTALAGQRMERAPLVDFVRDRNEMVGQLRARAFELPGRESLRW